MLSPITLGNIIKYLMMFLASIVFVNIIIMIQRFFQQRRISKKTQLLEAKADAEIRVPVTILTGFLGSGKTTILNHILNRSEKSSCRIMVIENELGQVSIDHELLVKKERNDIYVMQNGCMCCNIQASKSNELERILDSLIEISETDGYDHVIVETSGLADPGPIIQTFLQLRCSHFRLDSVVTMVDTSLFQKQKLDMTIEMERQLLYGDVIVLSKVDLLGDGQVEKLHEARKWVSSKYPDSIILQSEMPNMIDISQLLNVNTFNADRFRQLTEQKEGGFQWDSHTPRVSSVHINVKCRISMSLFLKWLRQVVDDYSHRNVFRLKGIVYVEDQIDPFIVQCVLDTYTIATAENGANHESETCKLVVIGREIDHTMLWESFLLCCPVDVQEKHRNETRISHTEKKLN